MKTILPWLIVILIGILAFGLLNKLFDAIFKLLAKLIKRKKGGTGND